MSKGYSFSYIGCLRDKYTIKHEKKDCTDIEKHRLLHLLIPFILLNMKKILLNVQSQPTLTTPPDGAILHVTHFRSLVDCSIIGYLAHS